MNTIKCPSCGTQIEVEAELQKQLETDLNQKYAQEYAAKEKELVEEKAKLENFKAKEKEIFERKLSDELHKKDKEYEKKATEERKEYEKSLKAKIIQETSAEKEAMQKELDEKSEQLKDYKKAQADIERLRREKDELRDTLKLESEKALTEKLKNQKQELTKTIEEKYELKLRESQKMLDDQAKKVQEMQRKIEQGSTETQGEVQEMVMEEWLKNEFPLDSISEIKKGARGADIIQTVNTRDHTNCGQIYYESKNTENFQQGWIEKLKSDMRDKNISVGVIVTKSMPSDMPQSGMREGIWVCRYQDFKIIAKLLRDAIIRVNSVAATQVNKTDKMQLLYDYLTGDNFKMQLNAIVEGFTSMKDDLEKEKRAMQRLWKKRETQLNKVIDNTIDMYGSLKGIAGNRIQNINSLELDSGDETLEIE